MEQEKAQAAHNIVELVRAISGEVAGLTEAFGPLIKILEEEDEEKIAKAKAVNVEELPPDVVRYWVAAKEILAREGYILTFDIRDWFANRAYLKVSVIPKRQRDIFGKPPIVAGFIISKDTQRLATRAEIIEALESHYYPEPVDYENNQIHGLEVLVHKNMIDSPDKSGIEALNSFQRAVQGNRLFLRRRVTQDRGSYGGEAIVLYQPQTPKEAQEFQPPLSHVQFLFWQEKKNENRYFEERMKYYLLQRLTGVLRAHIARTQ